MDLLDELDGEELLIVVDAVQFGAQPGSVHLLDWESIPTTEIRPVSGHGIGVKEALQVCGKLYPEKAAARVYLVGVEGKCFDQVGAGLTPEVLEGLPAAVEKIIGLLS
jgi:hydrogenase maturation protease